MRQYQVDDDAVFLSWNGVGRRFHRAFVNTKILVAPGTFSTFEDIYTSNIVYYSRHVIGESNFLKSRIRDDLLHIDRFRQQLESIVSEFFAAIDFFYEANKALSEGFNVLKEGRYWMRVNQFKEYSDVLNQFRDDSPKTHAYLEAIYKKYFYYLETQAQILKKSTQSYLFIPNGNQWPSFDCDDNLALLANEANQKTTLIRLLKNMTLLLNVHTNVLREISLDASPRVNPRYWGHANVSLSEGGVALSVKKQFKIYDKVDVFCLLPKTRKIFHVKGTIVRVWPIEGEFFDEIAVDFEAPPTNVQRDIRHEIQDDELEGLASAWYQLSY
ncbi:MAG: PilZ domain-containing protein [Thiomicrospira sp.]|nr:PilZ domain-containing protein [Thiomicrospira sp.]